MKRTLSKEEEERIIDFRHDMHVHPELSHEELETSAKIKAFLESLPGVEILPFREGKSGVVARVKGKAAGKDTVNGRPPEVALRVDIDALPKTEQSQVPFKSQVEEQAKLWQEALHGSETMKAQIRQMILYHSLCEAKEASGKQTMSGWYREYEQAGRLPAKDKREGKRILEELRARVL